MIDFLEKDVLAPGNDKPILRVTINPEKTLVKGDIYASSPQGGTYLDFTKDGQFSSETIHLEFWNSGEFIYNYHPFVGPGLVAVEPDEVYRFSFTGVLVPSQKLPSTLALICLGPNTTIHAGSWIETSTIGHSSGSEQK